MYGFLTVILSFAFWAAILYTVTGCLQLMMFEQTLKRQQPANATFKTMLPADRGQLKKIGLKILRGMIAVVILGLAKYKYFGQ